MVFAISAVQVLLDAFCFHQLFGKKKSEWHCNDFFFQTSRQCLSETHMASPPQLSLYSCLSGRCRYDDESAKWLAVSTWMHMREKMQHMDLGILQGSDGNFMGDLGNLVGFSRVLSGNSLGLEKAKRLLAIW